MPLTEHERERMEAENALAAHNPADAISQAVGEPYFSNHHRFSDLRAAVWRDMSVSSSGLAVSRFYFSASPPVVVDIIAQPDRAKNEVAAKRQYCAERGIRYVLIPDAYDDKGVRDQLDAYTAPARPVAAGTVRPPRAQKRSRPKAAA